MGADKIVVASVVSFLTGVIIGMILNYYETNKDEQEGNENDKT